MGQPTPTRRTTLRLHSIQVPFRHCFNTCAPSKSRQSPPQAPQIPLSPPDNSTTPINTASTGGTANSHQTNYLTAAEYPSHLSPPAINIALTGGTANSHQTHYLTAAEHPSHLPRFIIHPVSTGGTANSHQTHYLTAAEHPSHLPRFIIPPYRLVGQPTPTRLTTLRPQSLHT